MKVTRHETKKTTYNRNWKTGKRVPVVNVTLKAITITADPKVHRDCVLLAKLADAFSQSFQKLTIDATGIPTVKLVKSV